VSTSPQVIPVTPADRVRRGVIAVYSTVLLFALTPLLAHINGVGLSGVWLDPAFQVGVLSMVLFGISYDATKQALTSNLLALAYDVFEIVLMVLAYHAVDLLPITKISGPGALVGFQWGCFWVLSALLMQIVWRYFIGLPNEVAHVFPRVIAFDLTLVAVKYEGNVAVRSGAMWAMTIMLLIYAEWLRGPVRSRR
jgi:hypothetical protein